MRVAAVGSKVSTVKDKGAPPAGLVRIMGRHLQGECGRNHRTRLRLRRGSLGRSRRRVRLELQTPSARREHNSNQGAPRPVTSAQALRLGFVILSRRRRHLRSSLAFRPWSRVRRRYRRWTLLVIAKATLEGPLGFALSHRRPFLKRTRWNANRS